MKVQKILAVTAVATLMAVGAAHAEDAPATEKCYGVAKAGQNACKGANVACAGHSTKDGEGFIVLPAGTCDKLVNGSTTEPAAEPAAEEAAE